MKLPYRRTRSALLFLLPPVIASALPAQLSSMQSAASEPVVKQVTVTEGTNMSATVSPDGKTILLDLQEGLWSLPIAGGKATLLTDPLLEPSRPDWSPKGDWIAFQGYKGGTFHIWLMKPDGTGVRQLTDGHGDDREPRISPDGKQVAFASDRAMKGNYDIWVADIATGKLTQKTSRTKEEYEPTWSPDGSSIAFVSGTGVARGHGASVSGVDIESVDSAGNIKLLYSVKKPGAAAAEDALAPPPHIESPSFSPDGKLAFTLVGQGKSQLMVDGKPAGDAKDVFPFYASWLPGNKLLYTGDGKILITDLGSGLNSSIPFSATFSINRPGYRHRVYDFDSTASRQVKGIMHPVLSPDGKQVLFQALNQLWLMPIGGKPAALTSDTYYKQDASFSPDGKSIVYSSDADGFEALHIMDIASRSAHRVTTASGAAELSPAWSPDGKTIAYHDQNGATLTVDVASGKTKEVVPEFFGPSQPSWSADSKTLTMTVLKPYNMRFREGTSQILTLDLATDKFVLNEPAPFATILTRGINGPTYSPDGKSVVFVMDDFLWTMPVDSKGVPSGPARQVNHETSDSPSWSPDSKSLLYLSNTRLRMTSLSPGSTPADVPLDLTYRRSLPEGKIVIYAGTLWNGLGEQTVKNVDITIVKNRIASIMPHTAAATQVSGADKYIDASTKLVMPGLWESHNHMYGAIQEAGDAGGRLWLAYGYTELQSQGDEGYIQEEIRETFAANKRVGPRYFAPAELFDGERIFYPTDRSIRTDEQITREFDRAQSLDVDNYKSYVRLPHAQQKALMDMAHNKAGEWVASHYGLPGLLYGMDGMTHVSATSRWGYAYTRSLNGVTYGDVRSLFPAADMWMISTAFASTALYALDPDVANDQRLKILNQPWAEKALLATRDRTVRTNPTGASDALSREDDTVASLYNAGAKVMAGIDSFSPGLMIPLSMGIRAEAINGLKPWQALQTATILPARAFGYDKDLGSLEVGKLADLDIVNGNPLLDIKDMMKIDAVVINGRYYTQSELMAPFMPR